MLKSRPLPDNLDEYKDEFGYLGAALHAGVKRARAQIAPTVVNTAPVANLPTNTITKQQIPQTQTSRILQAGK